MRRLIFDTSLTGHHLEYIHYLYCGALQDRDNEYIFLLPSRAFQEVKNQFCWRTDDSHISFELFDDKVVNRITLGNQLLICYRTSQFLKLWIKKLRIDEVLLIFLAPTIPFLPLFLSRKIKITGIIYDIYLRRETISISQKILSQIRYFIMAKYRNIRALILNDFSSTLTLNRLYNTANFETIPDPVPEVDIKKLKDLRILYNIPANQIVYLHFGAMTERKGTLDLLSALLLLPSESLQNKTFIFAGKVGKDIKERFYNLLNQIQSKGISIKVFDEFCSYDLLNNLCHTANCIIIPYKLTSLSSGALGYAAVHGIPVIGPSKGLIGDLINQFGLGSTIDEINPHAISKIIANFVPNQINSEYSTENTKENFISCFLNFPINKHSLKQ